MTRYIVKCKDTEETAISPYFYFRNGLIHIRYEVDRAVELSESETAELKAELTASPQWKQSTLRKKWDFLVNQVGRSIITDGIAEVEERIHGHTH